MGSTISNGRPILPITAGCKSSTNFWRVHSHATPMITWHVHSSNTNFYYYDSKLSSPFTYSTLMIYMEHESYYYHNICTSSSKGGNSMQSPDTTDHTPLTHICQNKQDQLVSSPFYPCQVPGVHKYVYVESLQRHAWTAFTNFRPHRIPLLFEVSGLIDTKKSPQHDAYLYLLHIGHH